MPSTRYLLGQCFSYTGSIRTHHPQPARHVEKPTRHVRRLQIPPITPPNQRISERSWSVGEAVRSGVGEKRLPGTQKHYPTVHHDQTMGVLEEKHKPSSAVSLRHIVQRLAWRGRSVLLRLVVNDFTSTCLLSRLVNIRQELVKTDAREADNNSDVHGRNQVDDCGRRAVSRPYPIRRDRHEQAADKEEGSADGMKDANDRSNLVGKASHEAKEIRQAKSHGHRSERHARPADTDMEVNIRT